jgi:hypothetical protein
MASSKSPSNGSTSVSFLLESKKNDGKEIEEYGGQWDERKDPILVFKSLISQRLKILQGEHCETTRCCPRGWMCTSNTCLSKQAFPEPNTGKYKLLSTLTKILKILKPTYPVEVKFGGHDLNGGIFFF